MIAAYRLLVMRMEKPYAISWSNRIVAIEIVLLFEG